jgi:hypothetical protein
MKVIYIDIHPIHIFLLILISNWYNIPFKKNQISNLAKKFIYTNNSENHTKRGKKKMLFCK